MARRSAAKAKNRSSRKPLALGRLDRHLGYFVRRLQLWIFQDFIKMLAPMKVRPAQYSVLLLIEANPGRSQSVLGQALGIERARLARMLHELERRKWIARHANGGDARAHSLYLTGDGKLALTRIKRLADRHEARLLKRLGADHRARLLGWLREFG